MRANPLVIPPRAGAKPIILSHLDPDLSEGVSAGRAVLVFARNSGNGGRGAREACVLDACQAIDDLARFGLDLRPLMPTREDMDDWLHAAKPLHSRDAKSGNAFSNRFVEVWLTPQVMLGLSVGTGSRLSDETLSQPFMDYLAQRVTATVPILLHGKRWDRLGRRKWGLGPALEAMKTRPPAFIGEEDRIERLDEASELRAFIAGDQAERFAEKIPRQTRRGMRSRTGSEIQRGYAPYSLPAPPPPGMCRLRMNGGGVSASGEVRMYFESPLWLPNMEEVALGYPRVLDPDTDEVVDQVANVRWALARMADPNWTFDDIGRGLVNRRFSHTHIRQVYGPDAIAGHRPSAPIKKRHARPHEGVLRPIISNLEFYETGVLKRTLGVAGVEDVAISGVFPPDGPWADRETFAAIRARRSVQSARRRGSAMLLARLPVTINGQSGALIPLPGSRREPCYGFWNKVTDSPIPVGATVRHIDLAELIAEALDEAVATGAVLPKLGDASDDSPRLEQARNELFMLERLKGELVSKRERIFSRMESPGMEGPLLDRLTREYNTLVQDEIPKAERDVEAATAHLQRVQDDLTALAGVPAERLDHLVRALASPWDSALRPEIRSLVHSLSIRTERVVPHKDFRGYMAHMEVQLALRDSQNEVVIVRHAKSTPLSGLLRYQQRIEQRKELLRSGLPAREHKRVITEGRSISPSDLANALHLQDHQRPVVSCRDPRLLRINFAVVEAAQQGRTKSDGIVEEIAAKLDERLALVQRCWSLYGPDGTKTGRWARPRRPADTLERRCADCDRVMLWPLIDEVAGGVCPKCRRDEAGVEWSAGYDIWLTDEPTWTGRLPRSA